jgi:chromosome segregation ATPase
LQRSLAEMMRAVVLLLAIAPAAGIAADASANPVRKVVTLLQKMQEQVKKEGEKEKELYEKFMCYCKTGGSDLSASITAAETKIPQLSAEIESAESAKAETEAALAQARSDLKEAKAAMAAATAQREKEAAAFAKFQTDSIANIGAIVKAIAALEKGMAGAFLQTNTASLLKTIVENAKVDVAEDDRQQVLSFLSGNPFSQGYASQSGQITGILKQMGDEMATALAEATAQEEKAIHLYNQLISAKTEESDVLLKMIETKIQKTGELAVSIAEMKNDLGDTQEALAEDKTFLAELEKSCATKTSEWEVICKTRQEELLALAETIKILNNDDALELFKKTLPGSASFVQMSANVRAVRSKALALIQQASSRANRQDHELMQFIELALQGKKIGFEKVIKLIDEMVATLKKEQADDDSKKEYCATELDTSDDKKKSLEKTISDTEASIEVTKEGISTLTEEIAALKDGIVALDKSVAQATEQRKDENSDYKELMASDTAAKELLKMAQNRLNKFYNPKMYKAPAKVERSQMDAISQDVGGAAVLVQISEHRRQRAAPPPPPETFGPYTKKTEENGGVMAMIELLIKDLDTEMTEAETMEKDSQGDYEKLMADSAQKRAEDSKMMADKEGAKADLEGDLQAHKDTLKSTTKDLGATLKYIHDLHMECDWLLKYYDVRKEMRASEVDALGKAKAVLNGADYSL